MQAKLDAVLDRAAAVLVQVRIDIPVAIAEALFLARCSPSHCITQVENRADLRTRTVFRLERVERQKVIDTVLIQDGLGRVLVSCGCEKPGHLKSIVHRQSKMDRTNDWRERLAESFN